MFAYPFWATIETCDIVWKMVVRHVGHLSTATPLKPFHINSCFRWLNTKENIIMYTILQFCQQIPLKSYTLDLEHGSHDYLYVDEEAHSGKPTEINSWLRVLVFVLVFKSPNFKVLLHDHNAQSQLPVTCSCFFGEKKKNLIVRYLFTKQQTKQG